MWKKVKIDGIEVEFPSETVDDATEILEKVRRRKKEEDKGRKEAVGGKGEDSDLSELFARIKRKFEALTGEEGSATLRKARELGALEERRKALKEREEKYGYKAGKNAHLTKPKEYADVPESQFADPVGYNYPVNTPKRARAALAYFMRFHDQYDDVNAKLFIYERILRALKKFGIKRHFNPDFPGDWLMPRDLKEWMEGYDKYEEKDTDEMREKMLRRWGKKERRRLVKQEGSTFAVIPSLGSQVVNAEQLPSMSRELMENVGKQLESVLSNVIAKELKEFLKAFVEEMKDFSETVIETFDTLVGALKDSTQDMVDATKEAAEEIRSALGIERGEEVPVEGAPTPPEEEKPEEVKPEEEEQAEETPSPEGIPPVPGTAPTPPTPEELEEERRPIERLFKELLAHDLADEWSKWLTSPEPEESPEEEEGIVVDLEKGEFLDDLRGIETHVRFQDPETGKVTKHLEVDEEEKEE